MKFGENKKNIKLGNKDLLEPNFDKEEVKVVEEPQDLNSTAFSITNHPEGGFALVKIKYNPVTMASKVETVKKVADSREEAEYYFRVEVGTYFAELQAKS